MDHAIELELVLRRPPLRSTHSLQMSRKQLDAFIEENLASGRIQPPNHLWQPPVSSLRRRMGPSGWFRTTGIELQDD